MNTERLPVKSALLRWAREAASLSLEEAAKKTGIPRRTLLQWEELGGHPTPSQLEKIAEKYHRPSAAFFLPGPPATPSVGTDFRRASTHRGKPVGPSTQLALRRARWLQRTFIEVSAELGTNGRHLSLRARPEENPSAIASEARRIFGVSLKQQLKWNDPRRALGTWRSILGSFGVLVFQFRIVASENVRGFSLGDGVPVIALNSSDTSTGRVFTLFHELGHIVLARPGLCDPEEAPAKTTRRANTGEDAKIETFCDRFSGAFLVSRDALLQQKEVIEYQQGKEGDLVALVEKCSRAFGVSRLMFLRRLHDEGVVPTNMYWSLCRKWTRAVPLRRKNGGFASPPTKTLAELGPTFVSRVLSALDGGAITYSEVADYLSLRLKHMDRLRELLRGEASA